MKTTMLITAILFSTCSLWGQTHFHLGLGTRYLVYSEKGFQNINEAHVQLENLSNKPGIKLSGAVQSSLSKHINVELEGALVRIPTHYHLTTILDLGESYKAYDSAYFETKNLGIELSPRIALDFFKNGKLELILGARFSVRTHKKGYQYFLNSVRSLKYDHNGNVVGHSSNRTERNVSSNGWEEEFFNWAELGVRTWALNQGNLGIEFQASTALELFKKDRAKAGSYFLGLSVLKKLKSAKGKTAKN